MNQTLGQEVFLSSVTAVRCTCKSFYRPKRQISLPFHILQLIKSLPFYMLGKISKFSHLCHRHKMRLLVFLGTFTDRNFRFPRPFIYFSSWNPIFSYTSSLKKAPLSGGAYPYRSTPRAPCWPLLRGPTFLYFRLLISNFRDFQKSSRKFMKQIKPI